jgi:hypothetical protein
MKSKHPLATIRRIIRQDLLTSINNLFPFNGDALPLRFTQITEKFDVIKKMAFKGHVLKLAEFS